MTAPFSFFTPRPAPGPYRQAPALLPELSTAAPRPSDIERALVSGQLDPEARAQMATQVQAENAQAARNAPRSLLGGVLQNITIPLSLLSIPTNPLGARSVLSVREATNKAVGADPNAPGADLMELLGGFTPVGPELLAARGVTGAVTAAPNRAGLLAKALGLPDPLAAARPDVGPLKGMLERIAAPEVLPEAMNAVQRELSDAKGYATRVLSDPEASPELVQTAMARLEDAHLQHELAGGGFAEATPEAFERAITAFQKEYPGKAAFLTPRTAEQMRAEGMRMFLNPEGTVGYAVEPVSGDIRNVFNHGGPKGAGAEAVIDAVHRRGGRVLDAFDTDLTGIYRDLGFRETWRSKWSDEYRPPTWDEAKFGTPDVIGMEYAGPKTAEEQRTAYRTARQARSKGGQNTGARLKQGESAPADPTSWVDRLGQMLYDPGRVGMGLGGARTDKPIRAAAVRGPDGRIFEGITHQFARDAAAEAGVKIRASDNAAAGFVTRDGRFVTREQALQLSIVEGQSSQMPSEKDLYAEDILDPEAKALSRERAIEGPSPERLAKSRGLLDRLGQTLYDPGRVGMGLGGARTAKPKTDRPFRAAGVVAVNKKGERRIFEGAIHPQAAYKAARAGFRVDPDAEALGHNGFVLQDGTYVSRADAPKHLKKGEVPKAERLKMGEEPADPLSDFQLDSIPTPARRRRSAPQIEGMSLLHPDGSETRTVPTPLGPMTGTIPPKPGRLPNGLAPDRFFKNDYFSGTSEGARVPRRRYGYETGDAIYDIEVDQAGERTYLRNGKVVEPHRIHRAVEQQYGLPAEGPLAPEHRHDAPVEGHLRLMTDSIPSGTAPKPEGLLDRLGRALYDPGRMGMGLGSLRAERWVPEPRGIFDRSAPKLQGTAPIPPEMQASMSRGSVSPLVDALISSPKVRAGLREDVEQGLEIGGVPWYELGPVKASFDAMLREGDPVSFLDFLNLTGSASIQNPTHNELASYSALLRALEDGSTFDAAKRTIRAANPSFAAPWGTEGMLANAAQARARGNQFPSSPGSASRKVAWYTHGKRGGSRLADVALDTHERRRFAQLAARSRSAYRQLKLAGAAGPNDVIPIVNALDYTALSEPYRELAKEFDLPSAQAAQASRWLGGGKHTGLRSKPTGDYVQILEDAVLATAKATGRPTDPEALQQLWWDIVQGRQAAAPRYHAAQ